MDRLWNNGSCFLKKLSKVFDFRMGAFGTFFRRSADRSQEQLNADLIKENLFESTPND